jgi:CheY-like chemotaxis protein
VAAFLGVQLNKLSATRHFAYLLGSAIKAIACRLLTARRYFVVRSILIVEDDIDQLDALSNVLELAGYSTRCAQNGKEALDVLRTPPSPAIILLDLNMPVMNGWQFLAQKRSDPALVKVPVVAISGASTERPQGVAGFLRKPISPPAFLKVIRGYC